MNDINNRNHKQLSKKNSEICMNHKEVEIKLHKDSINLKYRKTIRKPCKEIDCYKMARYSGKFQYCFKHLPLNRKPICTVENCTKIAKIGGFKSEKRYCLRHNKLELIKDNENNLLDSNENYEQQETNLKKNISSNVNTPTQIHKLQFKNHSLKSNNNPQCYQNFYESQYQNKSNKLSFIASSSTRDYEIVAALEFLISLDVSEFL